MTNLLGGAHLLLSSLFPLALDGYNLHKFEDLPLPHLCMCMVLLAVVRMYRMYQMLIMVQQHHDRSNSTQRLSK